MSKRSDHIEGLLGRGGAINRSSGNYSLHHPSEIIKLEETEVLRMLGDGLLVVINCGCTGFWWALRPDLVAPWSARGA